MISHNKLEEKIIYYIEDKDTHEIFIGKIIRFHQDDYVRIRAFEDYLQDTMSYIDIDTMLVNYRFYSFTAESLEKLIVKDLLR